MRIGNKLIILFLLISTGPLIASTFISLIISEQNIENRFENHLESIASHQKKRLLGFISHHDTKMTLIVNSTPISHLTGEIIRNPDNKEILKELNLTLYSIIDSTVTFRDISIASIEGKILVSSNRSDVNKSVSEETSFKIGKNQTKLFNFFHDYNQTLWAKHVAPLISDGAVVGVFTALVDMIEFLALIQDYSGLGDTGETVLAQRNQNGDALFITDLRFDPNASLQLSVSKNDLEVPMTQALLGNESFFTEAVDYRNVPVLATTRYIEPTDWGLVVKIDKTEALSPITDFRNVIIISVLFLSLLILVFSYFFTRTLTNPIISLTNAANEVSKGASMYKVNITSQDEIGDLAESFNLMTENLIEAKTSLERKVKERTIDLERSNIELQQFAYIASHDLQEPLRTIARFLQLLDERYNDRLDSDAKEFIDFAVNGAIRMQQLIDDLLLYSRVDTRGKLFKITSMADLLKKVIANLELMIEENGVEITNNTLPSVLVDESQFIQLFQNLIENSIKFRGEERPKIHISSETTKTSYIISIKDNGIGIELEYHKRIFQIFQRLHTLKEYPGTGIGLAICKKIIERHNGQIWVESEVNKGSTFFIELPIERGDNVYGKD